MLLRHYVERVPRDLPRKVEPLPQQSFMHSELAHRLPHALQQADAVPHRIRAAWGAVDQIVREAADLICGVVRGRELQGLVVGMAFVGLKSLDERHGEGQERI